MIDRNHHIIKVIGDISGSDSHFLLSNIYHTIYKRGYKDIVIDFSKCNSIFAVTMLTICSYALNGIIDGITFSIDLPENQRLERLFINSNWAYYISQKKLPKSRFKGYRQVPATIYTTPAEQAETLKKIINSLLLSYEDLVRKDFAAIEWSINEIMDNVLVHSNSPFGGLVQLTTFNNENRKIEIVVSDGGIGIPKSLMDSNLDINTETKALFKCIEEGVTNGKGQGNGLFGTYNICSISHGMFLIDSGGANLIYTDRDGLHVRKNSLPVTGTTVLARINCNGNGTLEKALNFRNKIHHPIDFIEYEYEDYDSNFCHFEIYNEAKSVGSRIEGEPLRRKLKNLYNMTEDVIVIDFKDIEIISSSFGDELIAKLIDDIGVRSFKSRFKIANISETVKNLLMKSIGQRIKAEDLSVMEI